MEKQAKQSLIVNSAYKKVFADEDGKIVLHDLMRSTGYNSTTFEPCPYRTAFNEGARSVVVRILQTIEVDPEAFQKMISDMEDESRSLLDD